MRGIAAGLGALSLLAAGGAFAQAARPDQAAFREIYKELVETDTTLSAGDCTLAARKMAARLRAAGFAETDLHVLAEPEKPREGSLVAILKGSDPKAGAVLLLGHLDVVEARREDWTRDPFTLIEEGGYFYGRGTADMKGLNAIWVDTLIRLKQAKTPPRRTLKMALTCGEETAEAFNGADWLVKNRAELIAADFVLNEGGGGRLSADGRRETLSIQVGEKAAQSYRLTVTNPGGHSSRPRPDNAIYQLAEALLKVRAHVFPARFTETTRIGFGLRAQRGDAAGAALKRLLADPNDAEAARVAATDVNVNSILHTNCVTTRLDAGHANNALPQRATAVVNCRIFPGETVEETRATLERVIGDPEVKVETIPPVRPIAANPPLDPKVVGPMKALAAKHFPGTPVIPAMSSGATDGRYFGPAKTPVYGVPGIFGDPDGNGAHGLNERIRVRSLYEGRDYLFDLVKAYVGAK
ncbi:MAG: M20/M25/M40 family metallo-hydrolase [Phenylobacterium sp.]|uniref:M20/M25/M40 family metallo-hydrolase n=1 Tax=Phenylobacterium sp. TaxID=1871053 RepID=UPI001A37DF7B|nr:M20/M25/M40 family metallo-hydrolase [Phenylobacterium sp.]MBL8771634.1 M20/M25/M40 family metallo-hydrolase [Phenylobacterium sp.]